MCRSLARPSCQPGHGVHAHHLFGTYDNDIDLHHKLVIAGIAVLGFVIPCDGRELSVFAAVAAAVRDRRGLLAGQFPGDGIDPGIAALAPASKDRLFIAWRGG